MSRSATNKTELESVHSRPIQFVFHDFSVSPFRACTGVRDYVWGGYTWYGVGDIQGISAIADMADIAARPVTTTLTGVDSYVVDPVQSRTNYKNRSTVLYEGFLDSDFDLVDDPDVIWAGRMDVGSMLRDDTYTAQIVSEPLAARLLRPNISRYSDEDHQLRYSGDKFYEFLPQMEKKDVTWGGQRVAPSIASAGSPPVGFWPRMRRQF